MSSVPANRKRDTHDLEPRWSTELDKFHISVTSFEQFCSGPVDADTMAVLRRSQYSQRRLALRALIDQLAGNPAAVGSLVDPERAWSTLAAAERHDPEAVAEILLYPTVGVWLTRALHYTRPDRSTGPAWPELGYMNLVAAAAAIRSALDLTFSVPVWGGAVSLPTVGQFRLPGTFPVGAAEIVCAGRESRILVRGRNPVSLLSPSFAPTRQLVAESRGMVLRAWIEDRDPYQRFGEPRPSSVHDEVWLTEWCKLVVEAWDVLTRYHPLQANEVAQGLGTLVPIGPGSDVVGSSSPSAFGAIGLSGNGSAVELAEAIVHELQHSKLNALLGLIQLVAGDDGVRGYAPWRDDPRPLTGLLHGVVAFTEGIEFWARHRDVLEEPDLRGVEFVIGLRRLQVRRATQFLVDDGMLSRVGRVLVDAVSQRLSACERLEIDPELSDIAFLMADDHRAMWRLKFVRPDSTAVEELARAWQSGTAATKPSEQGKILADDGRRLPANRRNLLKVKAFDPASFESLRQRPASLPGNTPIADSFLCEGRYAESAGLYQQRVQTNPADNQAWSGLGLALRCRGDLRASSALLEKPEITVAAYRRIRLLGSEQPDPIEFADWAGAAL